MFLMCMWSVFDPKVPLDRNATVNDVATNFN